MTKRLSQFVFGVTALAAMLSWAPGARPFDTLDGEAEGEISLALVGAHLIDGTGRFPMDDATVLIAGNRIHTVTRRDRPTLPATAMLIDLKGKTLIPGFIDAHNHLEGLGLGEDDAAWEDTPEKMQQAIFMNAQLDLQSGVTTIREMGSSEAVLRLRDQIEAIGPRVIAAGRQLVKRDPSATAHPSFQEYTGVQEARLRVRELAAKGSQFIKVRVTQKRMFPTFEELKAIVEEAHKLGLRVAAHTDVPDEDAVKLVVQAGVDTIEHQAPLRASDDLLLKDIAKKNIIIVPTVLQVVSQQLDPTERTEEDLIESPLADRLSPDLLQGLRKRAAIWKKSLEEKRTAFNVDTRRPVQQLLRSLALARSLDVKLAIGTDCGADLVPHGRFYRELALFAVNGGVPVQDLIQLYARYGAEAIGKEKELGTIEPGKFADLVVLDGDPILDPTAFRNVVMVIKNGRVVEFPLKNPN